MNKNESQAHLRHLFYLLPLRMWVPHDQTQPGSFSQERKESRNEVAHNKPPLDCFQGPWQYLSPLPSLLKWFYSPDKAVEMPSNGSPVNLSQKKVTAFLLGMNSSEQKNSNKNYDSDQQIIF